MKRLYTQEDKDKIIELYKNGLSQKQVADIMGCSKSYVKNTLHQCCVPQRDKAYYSKQFDDNTEDKIIDEYLNKKMSIRDIAKKHGCTTMPIVTIFKRRGIKTREPSTYKKYDIDEYYFDEIDTEEKAYMLGFLYADGGNCSTKSHYIISLVLQSRDVEILERFRDEMKSNIPITDCSGSKPGEKYKQINICNKHIVKMLEKYGVVPRKSLILTYPHWLREDLVRHFMRDLFDGDGSISSNLGYINLGGSIYLMSYIKKMLEEKFNAHIRSYNYDYSDTNFVSLFCSKREDMANILCWMYDDSKIYLSRKYNLYMRFKDKNKKYNSAC